MAMKPVPYLPALCGRVYRFTNLKQLDATRKLVQAHEDKCPACRKTDAYARRQEVLNQLRNRSQEESHAGSAR